jgi:integrase
MGVRVREKPKGSKVWWIFINHGGQRRAKRVGVGKEGQRAAKSAAEKIQAQLALGNTAALEAPRATAPTFAALGAEWLTKYPALHAVRPATLENYRSFIEQHLVPAFGDRPVTAITSTAIEDFIETKRAPGGSVRFQGKALGDSSLRIGLTALRLILQRAVRLKLIAANPMLDVEWRRTPAIDSVDPFSQTELRAILQAAGAIDPDLATLLRVWAQSGMRAGEVSGLQPQDIDFERGTALVRRTWSRQRLGPTKTGRERLVSLLHPVATETAEWRPGAGDARVVLEGLRGFKVQPMDPTAFLFTLRGRPWTTKDRHQVWRRVLLAARVRYRNPEQLRHTFASTMLSRNAPLLYVQQQGGWRSAAVLLRVYARWLPQDTGLVAHGQPSATPAQPRAGAGCPSQ